MGARLLSQTFRKSLTKKLRSFAICRTWVVSSGEVYPRAEGVRESRCYTRGRGRGEGGDAMPVVNEEASKIKKSKSFYIVMSYL